MFQSKKKSEKWVYKMDFNLSPLDVTIDQLSHQLLFQISNS